MEIRQINYAFWIGGICIMSLLVVALYLFVFRTHTFSQGEIAQGKRDLPANAFAFSPSVYASLGSASLQLKVSPPRLHLPDLRPHLIYYGKNGRPDAGFERTELHFALQGGKALVAVTPDEPIYLVYDKKIVSPCKYTFSPNNQETLVWFTATAENTEARVSLSMRDQEGNVLSEIDGHGSFVLPEKELVRTAQSGVWELGTFRVDGTLLARQKARWVGVDRFLELHGGDEFAKVSGKHRIDFGQDENTYSVYVKTGDCLVWEDEHWMEKDPGKDTLQKPLLHVKKIEDRVMMLELWDVAGKGKVAMNLIRTPEHFSPDTVMRDFRFLGARTKTQVVFQIQDSRMIVRPNDWLLLTDEGWKKIKTAEDVDAYVSRKIIGPLFIFEDVAKKEEGHVMIGTLYNANRTEMQPIEVAVFSQNAHEEATAPARDVEDEHKNATEIPLANH